MKQSIIFALPAFLVVAFGQNPDCGCTGDTEADINRIEYQIPMDHTMFRDDVPGKVADFVDYLDFVLEDNLFQGIFDVKKETCKSYYRTDRTVDAETKDRNDDSIPKAISIKYRQTLNVNGFDNEKYQNDFSLQMGLGRSCGLVEPVNKYSHIFKCKNEANMFADETWCDPQYDGMQSLDYLVDGGNGYTGRLDFDDDPMYGTEDNPMTMVRKVTFDNFPYDCRASKLDNYFKDVCNHFFQNIKRTNMDVTVDKDVINFVTDCDFDINRRVNGVRTQVSRGKLTFQVRFDVIEDARNEDPTGRETEMSVKGFRDDTMRGEWAYTVDIMNQVVDGITKCGYPYIRYDNRCPRSDNPGSCPTYGECCRHLDGERRRWQMKCAGYMSDNDCTRGMRSSHCQWGASNDC